MYFALAGSYSISAGPGTSLATVCLSSTRIVLCNLALVLGGVCAG